MQDQSDPTQKPKRRRRKADRPAEIIKAAVALWAERGFAATRLEDVAAGAGIAKGTIYLYFSSKEALFEAAVQERLIAVLQNAEQRSIGQSASAEQSLRHFLTAAYTQLFEGGVAVFLKILAAEGNRFPELVTYYQEFAIKRGMATVTAILTQGAMTGEFRKDLATIDPRLIIGPLLAAGMWGSIFSTGPAIEKRRYLEAHLDLLLNGLRAAPKDP